MPILLPDDALHREKRRWMMNSTKVLVADDDPILRSVLVDLVNLEDDLNVIGQAQNGSEAVEKTRDLNPDVVLMDMQMPQCNGLEATRLIKAEFPEMKVILLTIHTNELSEAFTVGASKILLKDSPPEDLFKAIRENGINRNFFFH
jgi:DNA-binding NarL/FixJ family response regulator